MKRTALVGFVGCLSSLLLACPDKSAPAPADVTAPAAVQAPAAARAGGGSSAALAGTWGIAGEAFWEFKADGTGTFLDPEDPGRFKWTATDKAIRIDPDEEDGEPEDVPYTVAGDTLTVELDGEKLAMTRVVAKKP
jgi:hypothetical protein